jgi:hypothetical protein
MAEEQYISPKATKEYDISVPDTLSPFRSPAPFQQIYPSESLGGGGDIPPYRPWDLVGNGEGQLVLYRPLIRKANLDVSASVTFTNTAFVPAANSVLLIEISSINATAASSVYLTNTQWAALTEYPNAYKFNTGTPFAFSRARIPIWKFYGEDTGNLVRLTVDESVIWGEKLVHDGALNVGYILAAVPDQNVVRSVPALF